jgi:ABC-type sugar transport system ATPase subunit
MTALGVRVVHQDLGIVDGMSVLENVAGGRAYVRGRFGRINWSSTSMRVEHALRLVGLDIDPASDVAGLPIWQRVAVACARALCDGLDSVRLLILDEVTAALPPGEAALILGIVRRLQALGAGVVYVTHRFEEVIEAADWVTVLRNGEVYESRSLEGVSSAQLVDSVAGNQFATNRQEVLAERKIGAVTVEMVSVSSSRLRDINLSIRAGEICGVIGRAGCGRSALGRLIFWHEKATAGLILVDGEPLKHASPHEAILRGIAYIPQDRQRAGILPRASVRENLMMTNLGRVSRFGVVSSAIERHAATELVQRYGIVPRDIEEDIGNLSGGNQQKAVVGRWGIGKIRVFVLDEPTEGVDAGARQSIYRFIRAAAQAGAAVLLLSSSVEEIVETCDRALLMSDGAIVDEIRGDRMSVKEIEHLIMAGLQSV